jgi:hypothetical protein
VDAKCFCSLLLASLTASISFFICSKSSWCFCCNDGKDKILVCSKAIQHQCATHLQYQISHTSFQMRHERAFDILVDISY